MCKKAYFDMDPRCYDGHDPEVLLLCPYNKSHQIKVQGYPGHVMRCRKQHRGAAFGICPYNARHEMPRTELSAHRKECRDRQREEHLQQLAAKADKFKGCTDVPSYHYEDFEIPKSTEDWNDEIDEPHLQFNSNRISDPTWHEDDAENQKPLSVVHMAVVGAQLDRLRLPTVQQQPPCQQQQQPPCQPEPPADVVTIRGIRACGFSKRGKKNKTTWRPLQEHNKPEPQVSYRMGKSPPLQNQNTFNPPGRSSGAESWANKLFK